jgi:hypothetical protein
MTGLALGVVVGLPAHAALSAAQRAQLPPAARHEVDFAREVKPILETACIHCHGRGKAKGGFSLEDRSTALKGGDTGPAIVAGAGAESYLVELVSGLDPDNVMPQKGTRLKLEQVGVLRAWIDQGAEWDPAIRFGRATPLNLEPRQPTLPPARQGQSHPVDRWLRVYGQARGWSAPPVVDDRVYARRVYLDVIGVLPTPADLEAFLQDRAPDKRPRLVRLLLADHRRYAEHWLTFWNDALRNDYRGTGYIDGGREQITGWLYAALANNLPFDQFVRELVDPAPGAAGFVKGIVWRGVVNASQTPEMQAAQNLSQVFMGVNLKCASCHDSFINDWTLADAYGLAGIYAESPLEMVHCDKPTGKVAPLKFLYPELGSIDPQLPQKERRQRLAELITAETNGRLARTIVNRLWAKFLGRGLVEPLDEMEHAAWDPDLLDWLAADLVEHHYDLKRTMEFILTSQAYQWPAVAVAENAPADYVFRGPLYRRLSAEQYLDALSQVTGLWHALPEPRLNFDAGARPGAGDSRGGSERWIWTTADAHRQAPPQTIGWRRTFVMPGGASEGALVVACDNRFRLFVNGREVASGADFHRPRLVEFKADLVVGQNVIAVETTNDAAKAGDGATDAANPAGLMLAAYVRSERTDGKADTLDFATDRAWRWSAERPEGWTLAAFDDRDWRPAVELGPAAMAPWNLGESWLAATSAAALSGRVRSCWVANDPLMGALGRPNREQVVTSRATAATTLQALELTNGATLADWLRRGAARLVAETPRPAGELVTEVYQRALGRRPTQDERQLGVDLVGRPVRQEGVEDLLWGLAMLPEFQLIR